jgi:hypothetical protein
MRRAVPDQHAPRCRPAGAHGDFWQNSAHFVKQEETNSASIAIDSPLLVPVLGKVPLKQTGRAGGRRRGHCADRARITGRGVKLLGDTPQVAADQVAGDQWLGPERLLPLAFACFCSAR